MERATVEEIRKILEMISKGYTLPDIITKTVLEVAKREIEDKHKVVIYKRDPDTHSRRIQGAYVKIVEGNTIQIHPAVCSSFGADFDGDQMAVYAPLSEESQEEVKKKMISPYATSSINTPQFDLTKEALTGIFTLTYTESHGTVKKIKSIKEAHELDIGQPVEIVINGEKIKTTAGRVVFNNALPKGFPFINSEVNKKMLNDLMRKSLEKSPGVFAETLDRMMDLGFFYATIYPKTVSLDLYKISPKLIALKAKLSVTKEVNEQMKIIDEMDKELMDQLKSTHSDIYDMVASGGARGKDQIRQIMVCKGLISDPMGNILPPIVSSFNDGYKPKEYFDASAGARRGVIDRALNTASGGYSYRKMIYVASNAEADINLGNCGTRRTLDIKLTKDLFSRMQGRYVIIDENIKPINNKLIGGLINLRSPIFCKTRKICRTCYGDLVKQLNTPNVGLVAAQEVGSLAEKVMKSFHLGGIVSFKRPNIINEMMAFINDSYRPFVEENVLEKDETLTCNTSLIMLELDKNVYSRVRIKEKENSYVLPVGYFDLTIKHLKIPVRIEQETELFKTNNQETTEDSILINYTKGEKIFYVKPIQEDWSKLANEFDAYVSGRSPWSDVSSLFMKFWKNFSHTGPYDSVQLEVILSNILRNKNNVKIEARLKEPYNPTLINIKALPGIISWPLGLAFENFGQAISQGLISDRGPESPIEKLMFGIPLIEEKTKR
jgi:hypothetical protein